MAHRGIYILSMDQTLPNLEGAVAMWQGRNWPSHVMSLEKQVEKRLLDLRKMHMAWAFETGMALAPLLEPEEPLSMWWTSLIYERHPKLSPHLYTIYKLACVEEWLEEGHPEEFWLVGANAQIGRPLKALCEKRNVRFREVSGTGPARLKETAARKIYGAIPAPLRAILRFLHWWFTVKRRVGTLSRLPTYPVGQRHPATIATYFPNIDIKKAAKGRFSSRYWEDLHEALNSQARSERPDGPHFVRWLFIRFPSPDLSLADCIQLAHTFQKNGHDGLSFNFLEECLTPGGIFRAIGRWAKLCISSLKVQNLFAASCHLKDRYLNFQNWLKWEYGESFRGWRALERCLFNEAFLRYCQLAGLQRWTLYALENCPWERMLTEACRKIPDSGPVLGVQHSSIRPADFRYFDDERTFATSNCAAFQPDKIGGNGASAIRQWQQNNLPESRLVQVEALRYLHIARGDSFRPTADRRLLVATSFFPDETRAHLQLVELALKKGLLQNWQVIWKPHPYLVPREWLLGLPENLRNQIHLGAASIAEELAARPLVWASNSTTVALEALLAGLPVMVMAADNDFDLCPVQDVPGLVRTATLEDVVRGLSDPVPIQLEKDYLDLDPDLPKWRKLLGLTPDRPEKTGTPA